MSTPKETVAASNEAALDLVKAVQEQILDATKSTSRRSRTRLRRSSAGPLPSRPTRRPEGPHRGDLQVPSRSCSRRTRRSPCRSRRRGEHGARRQGQGEEVSVPAGLRPLVSESLWGVEAAALAMSPVWHGIGVPRGHGLGVLVIPGLLAGDTSVASLMNWLAGRCGYHYAESGFTLNVDCPRRAHRALEHRLEALVESTGRPAVVVGHSRGGLMAKLLAVLRPDLVTGIVTLGTPHTDPFAVHPALSGSSRRSLAWGRWACPGSTARRACPAVPAGRRWRTTSGGRWSRRSRSRPCTPAATAS